MCKMFSLLSLFSLSSLSRYKYLESIEHRSVNQSISQTVNQSIELSVQLKLDQFSDWLTYYYILSTHVNLSIRITFILSIKYWLYTWSKQSNQTHCQLNNQEFSKRIISTFHFFVTICTYHFQQQLYRLCSLEPKRLLY